jgi:hypothetical protein
MERSKSLARNGVELEPKSTQKRFTGGKRNIKGLDEVFTDHVTGYHRHRPGETSVKSECKCLKKLVTGPVISTVKAPIFTDPPGSFRTRR